MASLARGLRLFRANSAIHVKRHFAVSSSAPAQANLDPIQKLFLDKIKEYKTMAASGKIPGFDEKALKETLDRVGSTYGADKEDLTKFPKLQFSEPTVEFVDYEGAPDDDTTQAMLDWIENEWQAVGDSKYGKNRQAMDKDTFDKLYRKEYEKEGIFDKPKFL